MKNSRANEVIFLFLLIVLTLTIQLPLLHAWPFVTDENLYALMIQEQMHQSTLLPTLFGYTTAWKPPLFFWIYANMVSWLQPLTLPLEAFYRLPTVFFGVLCALAFYWLLRELNVSENLCFLTAILYVLSPEVIYTNNSVLTDTLAQLFIFLALIFYFKKNLPPWRFLLGGLFVALAFFTKFLLAAIAPLLVLGYFFLESRKTLRHPIFLVSLLALPCSIGLHFWLLHDPPTFVTLYSHDMFGNFARSSVDSMEHLRNMLSSVYSLFLAEGAWGFLSLVGLWKYWRNHKFFAFWYLLLLLPLWTAGLRPWYFLSIIPPIAYFSILALVQPLRGRFQLDAFTAFGFLAFLLIGITVLVALIWSFSLGYDPQKQAGELMAGKENVLFIGDYAIEPIAYKVLTESRLNGRSLDFGWVFMPSPYNDSADEYVLDYFRSDSRINDKDINQLYWSSEIFRKNTSPSHFDYVVLLGNQSTLSLPGDSLYKVSNVLVVKLKD